jgi:uridylate kinase
MKTLVISLGGSVLVPDLGNHRIREYSRVLQKIGEKHRIFIVTGGGGEARRYIDAARASGADEGTADEIGIMVTRLNAYLLIAGLGRAAYPDVARDQTEAMAYAESGKIVVMGGVTPAQTTDAVAAVLAERTSADLLVNLTSVDAIYSADPKTDPQAKRYSHLTPARLAEIVGNTDLRAGSNHVLDPVAVRIIGRSRIPLVVIDGRKPDNLYEAVMQGNHSGTIVTEEENVRLLPL